jgi:hypothetical protein
MAEAQPIEVPSGLVFSFPQDGSIRAKLIDNELYDGLSGDLIGFINPDGSCGNAFVSVELFSHELHNFGYLTFLSDGFNCIQGLF